MEMIGLPLALVCWLTALPGPPGVRIEDAYVQLYPIDRSKCPVIDRRRDILFEVYTRKNPVEGQPLETGNDPLLSKSNINFTNPTVIYFHAFFESDISTSATTIRTAFLQRPENYNIILLNAQRLEAGPWYFTAARNTRVVGQYSANFIDYLVTKGLQLNQLHLVGLSLGAQMAGTAGRYVTSGKIGRITGLDPAKPLYTFAPLNFRLDSTDANFVDVIHTDAGIFGFPTRIGHVDFWPNSGRTPQPGCLLSEVNQRSPDSIIEPFFCSHWRSYQFFAESVINPNSFTSVSCRSWQLFISGKCEMEQRVNMGYGVPPSTRGNYYLTTNPEQPYSKA